MPRGDALPTDSDGWWWFSSDRMTVAVEVIDGKIARAAPIIYKFRGQPVENLVSWMQRQGGFRGRKLENQ